LLGAERRGVEQSQAGGLGQCGGPGGRGQPDTASDAVPATSAPSAASGCARLAVRFQARTPIPLRSNERAMPAPMVPVPSTATVGRPVTAVTGPAPCGTGRWLG